MQPVFVADADFTNVFEILAAGGYATVVPLGTGFGSPWSVTADANGNANASMFLTSAPQESAVPPSIH